MALFNIKLTGLGGFIGRTRRAKSRIPFAMSSAFKAAKPFAKKTFTENALKIYAVKKSAFSRLVYARAAKNSLTVEATTFGLSVGKYFPVRPNKKNTTGNRQAAMHYAIFPNGWVYQQRGFMWKGLLYYRKGTTSLPVKKQTGPSVFRMSNAVINESESAIVRFCQEKIDAKLIRLL